MASAAATSGAIARQLGEQGWAATPEFLDAPALEALRGSLRAREAGGEFRTAAVGTGARRTVRPEVRGDRICWLHPPLDAAEQAVLAAFEDLRLTLNRELQLGLFELECHYAVYAPGTAYARHLDQLVGGASRIVSLVLYLNAGWQGADGGALRLYRDAVAPLDIQPTGGTLVSFLSERFEHEVLPAQRERLSLTGWLRRRSALGEGSA